MVGDNKENVNDSIEEDEADSDNRSKDQSDLTMATNGFGDTAFVDQYPEFIEQTPEELIELFGWSPELQESIDERDLAKSIKALRADLRDFRKKYSILNWSGTTFIHWVNSNNDIVFQKVPDFHAFNGRFNHDVEYLDAAGRERTKKVFVSKEFMNDPYARIFEGVEFAPGTNNPKFMNLWKGWNVSPKKGDVTKRGPS